MEFAQRSNVLLINLWGRKCSPRPIPLPSWDHPPPLMGILNKPEAKSQQLLKASCVVVTQNEMEFNSQVVYDKRQRLKIHWMTVLTLQ